MAKIIWMEPALSDLDRIAEYIAIHNPEAADRLVTRKFKHVEQLETHPESGSWPLDIDDRRYRQIVEPPCRVFYRFDGAVVYVIFVTRSEQKLKKSLISKRERIVRKSQNKPE